MEKVKVQIPLTNKIIVTLVVKQVFDYTFVVTDLNAKLNLLAKSNDFVKGFYIIIFLIYIFINVTYSFNVHHENW